MIKIYSISSIPFYLKEISQRWVFFPRMRHLSLIYQQFESLKLSNQSNLSNQSRLSSLWRLQIPLFSSLSSSALSFLLSPLSPSLPWPFSTYQIENSPKINHINTKKRDCFAAPSKKWNSRWKWLNYAFGKKTTFWYCCECHITWYHIKQMCNGMASLLDQLLILASALRLSLLLTTCIISL